MGTKIEWAEETWNPVTGCTKVSPGCANCYAERMSKRLAGRCGYPADEPFRVTLHPDRIDRPKHWRKPRMVFVCSMGDLFHPLVTEDTRLNVFVRMVLEARHTYQILTKRPDAMSNFSNSSYYQSMYKDGVFDHIWLGVSAENQECADKRIPLLLQTSAAIRLVSVEPMLGPVDFTTCAGALAESGKPTWPWGIHWVIIGCESGPGRRPMELDWARDLVQQCQAAEVPVFVKQLPVNGRVSHDPAEWPEDLRVREYPSG